MTVEIDSIAKELLGRVLEPVYSDATRNTFVGKRVLVTGAGGSIGSEIVRQLLALGVERVISVDRDEYALYRLDLSVNGSALLTDEALILADITVPAELDSVFEKWKPEIVFHAAAVKHLTLLEKSPQVALRTNVQGTQNVVDACKVHGVKRMVNISTDKAANPTSILGHSKRLAEMIAAENSDSDTIISSVRFGNVFASRGSFIETIQWQARNNHVITITDREVTRYFMSIPQAASLVIESTAFAESGKIYVLDMAKPVKIVDVVRRYLDAVGKDDVTIEFSGLRQGEKLHEIVYSETEKLTTTTNDKIFSIDVARNAPDLNRIIQTFASSEPTDLRRELARITNQ